MLNLKLFNEPNDQIKINAYVWTLSPYPQPALKLHRKGASCMANLVGNIIKLRQ